MKYFLLMYDRRRHRILERREFALDERDDALAARGVLVQQHREDPDMEIVLLGANTFDDLKRTHGRYFKTADQLVKAKA